MEKNSGERTYRQQVAGNRDNDLVNFEECQLVSVGLAKVYGHMNEFKLITDINEILDM